MRDEVIFHLLFQHLVLVCRGINSLVPWPAFSGSILANSSTAEIIGTRLEICLSDPAEIKNIFGKSGRLCSLFGTPPHVRG